jgi:hypothetical protein
MIKRLFGSLMLGAMLLAGGGCSSSTATVEGKWRLSFNLPEGWAMVKEYNEPRKETVAPSTDVTHDLPTVVIQSTTKAIARSSTPTTTVPADTYITSNFSKIMAYKLDDRRKVPSSATDLGNGFYQDTDAANVCTGDNVCRATFYYVTPNDEKYQFTVYTNMQSTDTARSVILSAQPVTSFTDTAPAASATESDVQTNEAK